MPSPIPAPRRVFAASPASPAWSLGAEVRQVARVPGAAKSRRTESAAQLCCGTGTAGSAAPAAEPGLPPRGTPASRPRGPRGSGRGAVREHLGWAPAAGAALPELRAPRAPRLQVRRPRRAGWSDSAARVAAVRAAGGVQEGGGREPGTHGCGLREPGSERRRRPGAPSARLPSSAALAQGEYPAPRVGWRRALSGCGRTVSGRAGAFRYFFG